MRNVKILTPHRYWGFEPPGIIQRYRVIDRILHKLFPEGSRMLILDLGCGSAPYFPCYANYHKLIIGVDINEHELLTARGGNSQLPHLRFELIRADVRNLPIKKNTVDIIVATEILEHTPFPSLTLQAWHQILRDGGYIILSVPGPFEFLKFLSSTFLRQITLLREERIGLLFKILFSKISLPLNSEREKAFFKRPIISKIIDIILPLFLSFKYFPNAKHYNSVEEFVQSFYYGIPDYFGHQVILLPSEWKSIVRKTGFKVIFETGAVLYPLPTDLFLFPLWKIKFLRSLFLRIEQRFPDCLKKYLSKSLIIVGQK